MHLDIKAQIKRRKFIIAIISLLIPIICLLYIYLSKKEIIEIPCIINRLTGLYCPGCGNTRAATALFHLDIKKAFQCNPLFALEFFYIGWLYIIACINYIKTGRFSYRSPCTIFDIFVLIVIVIWGVIRNILPLL